MSNTTLGLIIGLVAGFAGALAGLDAFLVVLVCGAIGSLVGRALDGELDLGKIADLARHRRRVR
jgi:hypothetical protein